MVYDHDGNILVQDRKNKNWPGINFPGGHVEPDESFVSAAIREVKEETGLLIENPKLCGAKQFKISKTGERFICLFFKTDKFSGEFLLPMKAMFFGLNEPTLKIMFLRTVSEIW